MNRIRVVQWGLGNMGSGMVKMVHQKKGMQVVGAIDCSADKAGKDLGEYVGLEKSGVVISDQPEQVIKTVKPDVVLLATNSFTREVHPFIKTIVMNDANCITIAEEVAYPAAQEPDLAKEIDDLAKEHGVTVLGTGINPGFILDTLIIALTGACINVKKIKAARVNDLSPFGATVMKTQGVGTSPEEFAKGLEEGAIVGHIGFTESIYLIANAMGLDVDRVEQTREPIISNVHRETPVVKVQPGMVAGCRHCARGFVDGEVLIELEHPQQIHPEKEGVETGDFIWIEGTPNINLTIKPEIPGGIGTIAIAVNMIPQVVLKAAPGLTSMKDLPVPASVMGDVCGLVVTD